MLYLSLFSSLLYAFNCPSYLSGLASSNHLSEGGLLHIQTVLERGDGGLPFSMRDENREDVEGSFWDSNFSLQFSMGSAPNFKTRVALYGLKHDLETLPHENIRI